MKLLVTGASGFLGRRTAAYFSALGYEVLTPTHGQMDITDRDSVRSWFRKMEPEAVFHTAAISNTGLCQQRPQWSETINVAGCVHVAQSCRELGSKLVLCSTDQVYFGSALPGPHREEEVLTPCNVYGSQKLRAEQQCLDIHPDTVCLRLSWMYDLVRCPEDHSHFLTTLLEALEDPQKPLTWPIYDVRGITHVAEVLANLPQALKLPGGAYNFGAENDESTYHMVYDILKTLNMEQALARLTPNTQAFAEAPRDMSLDLTKANAAGIRFSTTKQGLLRVLQQKQEADQ